MISGIVLDAQTGEGLPNASVYISDREGNITFENRGVATNSEGRFTIESSQGDVYITASYTGYEKQTRPLFSMSPQLTFRLQQGANMLQEVEIIATKDRNQRWLLIIGLVAVAGFLIWKYYH